MPFDYNYKLPWGKNFGRMMNCIQGAHCLPTSLFDWTLNCLCNAVVSSKFFWPRRWTSYFTTFQEHLILIKFLSKNLQSVKNVNCFADWLREQCLRVFFCLNLPRRCSLLSLFFRLNIPDERWLWEAFFNRRKLSSLPQWRLEQVFFLCNEVFLNFF